MRQPFGSFPLNDGNEIPAIAYGTGIAPKDEDATKYIEQALNCGFSHIDTAQLYGTEESTGKAIRESGLDRSELYVTTKYSRRETRIQQAIRDSLNKLGLKYVDLYLIHSPAAVGGEFEGAWREFEKIKKDGLAKSIGVSNFSLEQLQALIKTATIKPVVNQIELHPYNYAQSKPLLQYAILNDIVIEAYGNLRPITNHPGGPVDKPVKQAALRRGALTSQILLAWVRAKGAVIVTTSRKKEHLRQSIEVADIYPLTDAEIAAIDEAGALGPSGSVKSLARRTGEWILVFVLGAILYFVARLSLR